jgi:hypothetical protein
MVILNDMDSVNPIKDSFLPHPMASASYARELRVVAWIGKKNRYRTSEITYFRFREWFLNSRENIFLLFTCYKNLIMKK